MKRITYKEIAKQANVSISTISRYFNSGYVGPEKHAAISKVLLKNEEALNFCFLTDRNLSQQIYFVLSSWNNEEAYKIIQTLDDVIKINPSDLLLNAAPGTQIKKYLRHLKEIMVKKPRALILMDPPQSKDLAIFLESLETDTVIISFGVKYMSVNSIFIDYRKIIQSLSEKLFEKTKVKRTALLVDTKLSDNLIKDLINSFKAHSNTLGFESFVRSFDHRDIAKTIGLLKSFRASGIKNIICSNENVFKNVLTINKDNYFNLAYIGYTDFYDYHNYHFIKSFIDYHFIWILIENLIVNNIKNKQIAVEGLTISSMLKLAEIEN